MKNNVTDMIGQKVLSYIIDNDFKVGDKLPNEYELARIIGVSRSTIREGIRELISRNILVVKQGSGTYVSNREGVSEDPLGLGFLTDKKKLIIDTTELRFLIEPHIAMKAALYATPDQKQQIEQLCNEVEDLILNGQKHLSKDVAFHTMIAKSCGNQVMSRVIPVINESIYLFGDATKMNLKESTIRDHRAITNAILKGDPIAAHDAMYLHLVQNRNMILQ